MPSTGKPRLMPRKPPAAPALSGSASGPRTRPPRGTKSAFIRSLPEDLSAHEVVEKAKAAGIKITAAHVFNIRSDAKRRAAARRSSGPAMSGAAPGRPPLERSDSETRLGRLIAEVGLFRAREVLAEVAAAFKG